MGCSHGRPPRKTTTIQAASEPRYEITATRCEHLLPGQCIGFIVTIEHFGTSDGKPNALYFSGDTVYLPELATIKNRFSVPVALFNLGKATVPKPGGGGVLQITIDGEQAVRLLRDIDSEVVVPMHFEGWNYFIEGKEALRKVFENAGVGGKFKSLEPGFRTKIV